jgi:hypothetical protein
VHGCAVTLLFVFPAATAWPFVPVDELEPPLDPPLEPPLEPPLDPPLEPPLEPPLDPPLEPPLDPPLDPPLGIVHGGMMTLSTLLLRGSTSWFCGGLLCCCEAPAPPGVIRTVFATAGIGCAGHGGTATVCVSVPFGTTISFEPGGRRLAPVCSTAAAVHGVTTIEMSLRCLGMTTVRMPGVIIAVATGSCAAIFLLPQPPTTSASSPTRTSRPNL